MDNDQIEIVNVGDQAKKKVRALIAQPRWDKNDWAEHNHLLTFVSEEKPRVWLDYFLRKAQEHACDLVLMPELSVPQSLENMVAAWTRQTGSIVVGGSYYAELDHGYVSRCPIAVRGEIYHVEKLHPAPAEISPLHGKGLMPGTNLKIFNNSLVGRLGVLICSDYLKEDIKTLVLNHSLDILCIPAFQKNSKQYHQRIDIDVEQTTKGLYVLYANNWLPEQGDGRSAAFAIMDDLFRKRLIESGHTDNQFSSKLIELKNEEDCFIVDLDLECKRPSLGRTVESRPNLSLIEIGKCSEVTSLNLNHVDKAGDALRTDLSGNNIQTKIISELNKLISAHELDDSDWSKAFSSMYFLAKLGRLLKLTNVPDYSRLLDHFLKFLNFRANDTFYLREDQILVTPGEIEKIRQFMEDEDKIDPFFTRSNKTRASSINFNLMHENYLYGVALGISTQVNTTIMRIVRDAAINHLIYSNNSSAMDAYGGWCPYRVPWITARILISFADVDLSLRADQFHIKTTLKKALESLADRLCTGGYWRSGVGEWVSMLESTALCLEAFLRIDSDRRFAPLIRAIVPQIIHRKQEWLTDVADFTTEQSANETLASVLMASVLLRICREYNIDVKQDEEKLYGFLLGVLEVISESSSLQQRQFCTIPQVAAYCAGAVLE